MKHRHLRAWFGVIVIGTAALVGCGDDGQTASTATTGGETTSTSTGNGGGGTGGAGGNGGAGGGAPTSKGAPGTALVGAGHVISSPKYRMVFTVGQSSPVQTNVSSSKYTLRGGLIGATGSAK